MAIMRRYHCSMKYFALLLEYSRGSLADMQAKAINMHVNASPNVAMQLGGIT